MSSVPGLAWAKGMTLAQMMGSGDERQPKPEPSTTNPIRSASARTLKTQPPSLRDPNTAHAHRGARTTGSSVRSTWSNHAQRAVHPTRALMTSSDPTSTTSDLPLDPFTPPVRHHHTG